MLEIITVVIRFFFMEVVCEKRVCDLGLGSEFLLELGVFLLRRLCEVEAMRRVIDMILGGSGVVFECFFLV